MFESERGTEIEEKKFKHTSMHTCALIFCSFLIKTFECISLNFHASQKICCFSSVRFFSFAIDLRIRELAGLSGGLKI